MLARERRPNALANGVPPFLLSRPPAAGAGILTARLLHGVAIGVERVIPVPRLQRADVWSVPPAWAAGPAKALRARAGVQRHWRDFGSVVPSALQSLVAARSSHRSRPLFSTSTGVPTAARHVATCSIARPKDAMLTSVCNLLGQSLRRLDRCTVHALHRCNVLRQKRNWQMYLRQRPRAIFALERAYPRGWHVDDLDDARWRGAARMQPRRCLPPHRRHRVASDLRRERRVGLPLHYLARTPTHARGP
mmetsp:Transcript_49148/g.137628  ORF Transcript_49148/g.137628 Transcript_49148/m.137628 type:complete len:249 (+) Transcript_49148:1364-2110(+)